MTPNIIASLPPGPTLSPSPMQAGDASGFSNLLDGFEVASLPAAVGSGLPGGRQELAGAPAAAEIISLLPGIATEPAPGAPPVPEIGPGCAIEIPDGALPSVDAPALPPMLAGLVAGGQEITKSRIAVRDRPLPIPMPAVAEPRDPATPLPGDVLTDPATETSEADRLAARLTRSRRSELRPELGFAPEAAPAAITVSARVAETPAITRAAVTFDPSRTPAGTPAKAELATVTPEKAATPEMPAPPATDPVAVETPPAPLAEAKPAAPDRADVAQPADAAAPAAAIDTPTPAADPADAAPAAVAARLTGLARAFERSEQPRLDPAQRVTQLPPGLTRRSDRAEAGAPFVPIAATAERMPAPLAAVEPAAPAMAPSFGFHPATPIHVRAADFAANLPPIVDTSRADWLQSMIERIGEIRQEGGAREAQIRLAPDALGKIDIRIEQRDDRMHVTMHAENPQARAMLAEAAPRLQEMAEARGLRLTQSGADASQSQQQQQRRFAPDGAPQPLAPRSARSSVPDSARSHDRIA